MLKREKLEVVSFGDLNDDLTFYLIRRFRPRAGFFSNFHHVLGHILIAMERNWIPVVDMQNYDTFYDEVVPINESLNTWEHYFVQPGNYPLEEVYQSKRVVLSDGKFPYQKVNVHFNYCDNAKAIKKFNQIISTHIQVKPIVAAFIEDSYRLHVGNRKNVLGVLSRGTDMKFAVNHNCMPSPELLIIKARELLSAWNYQWVFLATEEESVVDLFKSAFGEQLLVSTSRRIKNYNNEASIPKIGFNRKHDNYMKGLEYLSDITLLSRCDSILCPLTNGSAAAIELNGNRYENKCIINLGVRT